MASRYIEGAGRGAGSKVALSPGLLSDRLRLDAEAPFRDGLFGHTVTIRTGAVVIRNQDLDCEFDIPFRDEADAKEAEIVIYNLSDATLQGIKKDEKITVTAGFGDDAGMIFSGYITKIKSCFSDLDRVTEIKALDSMGARRGSLESISYQANTTAGFILKDLIGRAGLPLAEFSIARDYTYKDGTTAEGSLMDNIRRQAKVCGASFYICKSQAYVRPASLGEPEEFLLSGETGLLELSEFEEGQSGSGEGETVKGYEATMLLQHRVATAGVLRIQSRNVSGLFRVREGSHTYDGTNFLTKVKAVEYTP